MINNEYILVQEISGTLNFYKSISTHMTRTPDLQHHRREAFILTQDHVDSTENHTEELLNDCNNLKFVNTWYFLFVVSTGG